MELTALESVICQHFGVCGGCRCASTPEGQSAPPPYDQELAAKEAAVRDWLGPYPVDEWRPIIPSPDIWHYRNKMEYAIGGHPGVQIGLREAGRFDLLVDVETCFLMSPESVELIRRVRVWAKAKGLTGYHRRAHMGDLRYLVVREGKNTGQRMAVLITNKSIMPDSVGDLIPEIQPLLSTCWLGRTDSQSDVARTEDMTLLWGSGSIEEKLGPLTFRVSPYSFFQTNTHGTERLYGLLDEWAVSLRGGALLDLYCGSGGITLSLASSFDRVVGIDTNKEAIQDGMYNAQQNNLSNVEFVATDAEEFLKKLPASKLSVQLSAVVVDPPRPGLHPKALKALLELNPPHLGYVSCNPESLARDLQGLSPFYRIRTAQTVDLFPHTPHIETFVALEHR